MFNYIKYLIILLYINQCHGHNLVAMASGSSFLEVCDASDNSGDQNVNDLMQFNLRNEYADDMETLVTNGNITFLADPSPDEFLVFSLEILEWKRGQWQQTIYSMRRENFCSALFDPSELWYPLTKSIPAEDRICPPKKGTVYHLNDLENRIELEDTNVNVEGLFKIISHVKYKAYAACVTTIVDVWKN